MVEAGGTVDAPTVAQPDFLKPRSSFAALGPGEAPGVGVGVARATGGFVILTPAAFASLRSSFSSRFLSFSFLLSTSSWVFRFARAASCMSRKRALWWWA